jgi:hypothetical protein
MKPAGESMTLEDLESLLVKASQISNHRRFVIAGSLSVIGAVVRPPAAMVMSRDLDFYPQLDPERGFIEIASQLGEGSPFHKAHGYYADPITPELLSLPGGWENRVAPISLRGGVVAMFLDPNDVAIGKLMRGHENDVRWLAAGLRERVLSWATVQQRMPSVHNASQEDHRLAEALLRDLLAAFPLADAPKNAVSWPGSGL